MPWPNASQYDDAVQNPRLCFSDPELKAGEADMNAMGLPRPVTGSFASVYSFRCGKRRWAVRCFLRDVPDNKRRYQEIDAHLRSVPLPYTVGFEYQEKGIQIGGVWYPILKMEWIEGIPLNRYIENNLGRPDALTALAKQWVTLIRNLQSANVAHGDLQHGNILVVGDALRLIDYDGMYVPALGQMESNESGHAAYQHPKRTGQNFDATIDRFPALSIYVAVRALRIRPDLWSTFNNDDNLLFRKEDFQTPDRSRVFAALAGIGDAKFDPYVQILREACGLPLSRMKDVFVRQSPSSPPASRGPAWIADYTSPIASTQNAGSTASASLTAPKKTKKTYRVRHTHFGDGTIQSTERRDGKTFVIVLFDSGESKKLLGTHEALTYLDKPVSSITANPAPTAKKQPAAQPPPVAPSGPKRASRVEKTVFVSNVRQRDSAELTGAHLHSAVTNGDTQALENLLRAGANPNARAQSQRTPLHKAVLRGKVDLVRILLSYGADCNAVDDLGMTALHYAAYAAEGKEAELASILLQAGADTERRNIHGYTAYEIARPGEGFQEALDKSKSPSQPIPKMSPTSSQQKVGPLKDPFATLGALSTAVRQQDLAEVTRLLASDAALIRETDAGGNTPLHHAVLMQDVGMVDVLLKYKANPLVKNNTGMTAVALAKAFPNPDIKNRLTGTWDFLKWRFQKQ